MGTELHLGGGVMSQLGERLRQSRRDRGWTLRQLAERSGLSPSHLCGIERGTQRPSTGALDRLALAFGVSLGAITQGIWRPRPRARWCLRTRGTRLRRLFRYKRPRTPESTLAVQCREAGYYPLGKVLIERVRAQQRRTAFWTGVRHFMHGQNGAEQMASLHLLQRAVDFEEIEPQYVRFHLPVLQEPGRRWIAMLLEHAGCTFLFYPQVTVKGTTGQTPTLDFVVRITDGAQSWTVDVEIDGPGHDRQLFKDAERDVVVNLPVLRVRLRELDDERFAERLLERLMKLR